MSHHTTHYSTPFRSHLRSTRRGFILLVGLLLLLVAQTNTHSARLLAPASAAAQGETDVRSLEPGKPIERELAGGQAHSYQITLSAGQYLNVMVEQQGIDVVVALFGPDGKKLIEVDSPNGTQG